MEWESVEGSCHVETLFGLCVDADGDRLTYVPGALAPEAPGALDEVRLAAGWVQAVIDAIGREGLDLAPSRGLLMPPGHTPAPGPAGMWRMHASGVWVCWVVADGGGEG